jgi:hypothetical protein
MNVYRSHTNIGTISIRDTLPIKNRPQSYPHEPVRITTYTIGSNIVYSNVVYSNIIYCKQGGVVPIRDGF